MDCFENIIGLSPSGSDVLTTNVSEGNKKSNSGLYIDGMEETQHILKTLDGVSADGKDVNTFFVTALKSAVAAFREKLFIEIGTRYTVRQPPYTGLIGQNNSTGPLALTGSFAGAAYEMLPLRGGTLRVTKIYVAIDQTISLQVRVYKAYVMNGMYSLQEQVGVIDVDTVANTSTPKLLDTPLELPLQDESNNVIHYLFLMDRTTGYQPLNVKADCGCGSRNELARWLTQSGVQGDDPETIRTSSRNSSYVNGIVVGAELQCNDTSFVCASYAANPFIKTAIEHAILYQTASNLIQAILRTDMVNRFALTKREQMATDIAILHNKFKSRIPWIAENIDMKPNNCFVCNTINEVNSPYKTSIKL